MASIRALSGALELRFRAGKAPVCRVLLPRGAACRAKGGALMGHLPARPRLPRRGRGTREKVGVLVSRVSEC